MQTHGGNTYTVRTVTNYAHIHRYRHTEIIMYTVRSVTSRANAHIYRHTVETRTLYDLRQIMLIYINIDTR